MKTFKSALPYLAIFVSIATGYFIQSDFSKANPYDPNWIYGDDSISFSRSAYGASPDKNAYLTVKNTQWKIRTIESVRGSKNAFLMKTETVDFVKDMLSVSSDAGFHDFLDSVAYGIFYDDAIMDSVKDAYAKIVEDVALRGAGDADAGYSEYVKGFDAEMFSCGKFSDAKLKKADWMLLWSLGTRAQKKEDFGDAYCYFLLSGYGSGLDGWYESVVTLGIKAGNFSTDSELYDFRRKVVSVMENTESFKKDPYGKTRRLNEFFLRKSNELNMEDARKSLKVTGTPDEN